MKVFIQKSENGLFLKTESVWVSLKADAKAFENCTPCIDYCVDHKLEGVRLCLSFGDSRYDLYLEVFRAETKALVRVNRELREKKDVLLRQMDLLRAESKERKKQFAFKRRAVGESARQDD